MGFTPDEMKQLKQSPYIDNVFRDQIVYGKLFYQEFWRIRQLGYTEKEAFEFLGLDPDIVGSQRIRSVRNRVKDLYKTNQLYETEEEKTFSISQQLEQKDREIKKLRQEVEFF